MAGHAFRPVLSGNVAAGATSAASTIAAPAACTRVRLVATVDTYAAIGTSPTATATTSFLVRSYHAEEFVCDPGDKVAALALSTAGILNIAFLSS